jgi:hypothetical protein
MGMGQVELSPGGEVYAAGTVVTLTAIPAPGSVFYEWGGDLTGADSPTTLLMDGDRTVHATFLDPPDCSDGIDNDGDGLTDHPADPGCRFPTARIEDPQCDNGVDDDGDGGVDFAGTPPDADCEDPSQKAERGGQCGLGAELAALLPALAWLRRRRVVSSRPLRS